MKVYPINSNLIINAPKNIGVDCNTKKDVSKHKVKNNSLTFKNNFDCLYTSSKAEIISNKMSFIFDMFKRYVPGCSTSDFNVILSSYSTTIMNAYEIIGEKSFEFLIKNSYKNSFDEDIYKNILKVITAIGSHRWEPDLKEAFVKLTHPTSSQEYMSLKEEIAELKCKYSSYLSQEERQKLQQDINTKTYKLGCLTKSAIKDPKDIIDYALITSELCENKDLAIRFLRMLKSNSFANYDDAKLLIFTELYGLDDIPNAKETINKLGIPNSKYFLNFFKANIEYRKMFKDFLQKFANNPDKTPLEVYNQLEMNKKLKLKLEEMGVDYDKYTTSNHKIVIENIKNEKNGKENISVHKVNMNNVIKSLTLGDEATCCTKITGIKAESAIAYAENKMFSAIEILEDDIPIGNAMCFYAYVDDKVSFIIDNIEVKTPRKCSDSIRDAIFKCAREITKDAGTPDVNIYLGTTRNDVMNLDLKMLPKDVYLPFELKHCTYFDFINSTLYVDYKNGRKFKTILYSLDYNSDTKEKSSEIIDDSEIVFDMQNNLYLYLRNNFDNE